MTAPARQLPLPLPVRAALGESDFLVTGSNREAVAWLDAWPEWPGGGLVLLGPRSCGKSHLLAIWRKRAEAAVIHGSTLTLEQSVSATGAVAIDDADQCPDPRVLFHLINQVKAAGGSLLLTASRPTAEWAAALPDLRSRLNALPVAQLQAPDDALLAGLAAKLFHDRQITLPDDVVQFMLNHLERSCAAIADAVEKLDQASWAERRALTVPLARKILTPEG
jgi:DnaA regulatory inactivator Hda